MSGFRLLPDAKAQVDAIFDYTYEQWGEEQAERYFRGLQSHFKAIASREWPWRKVAAELGVEGYCCRYQHHIIYWRVFADDSVGIVAILHERMSHALRLRDAFND